MFRQPLIVVPLTLAVVALLGIVLLLTTKAADALGIDADTGPYILGLFLLGAAMLGIGCKYLSDFSNHRRSRPMFSILDGFFNHH